MQCFFFCSIGSVSFLFCYFFKNELKKHPGDKNLISYIDDLSHGKICSVGVGVTKEDSHFIVDLVYKDYPAHKANIMQNDEIIKINNKNIANLDLEQVNSLLKGKNGTKVKLCIKRGNKTFETLLKLEFEKDNNLGKIIFIEGE